MTDTKRQLGLVHIYCGDGKGKTSAAMGLALRAAGNGLKVLIVQCLKTGTSGEIAAAKKLGADVLALGYSCGFSVNMGEEDKKRCREAHDHNLQTAIMRCRAGEVDVLILDEMNCAAELEMVDIPALLHFLDHRPEHLEVVLTGRNPPEALLERADYISEIRKVRHPFDKGVPARKGIEM